MTKSFGCPKSVAIGPRSTWFFADGKPVAWNVIDDVKGEIGDLDDALKLWVGKDMIYTAVMKTAPFSRETMAG